MEFKDCFGQELFPWAYFVMARHSRNLLFGLVVGQFDSHGAEAVVVQKNEDGKWIPIADGDPVCVKTDEIMFLAYPPMEIIWALEQPAKRLQEELR